MKWFLRCVVLAAMCCTGSMSLAEVIADLGFDYVSGTTAGDTTTDVGLPGTMGGAWNYYEDLDGIVADGSPVLLGFTPDSIGANYGVGDEGYMGTGDAFGIPGFSAITPGQIFNDNFIELTASDSGPNFLQVHPGGSTSPYLALKYEAGASLSGLVMQYELHQAAITAFSGEASVHYSIVEVIGGVASPLVSGDFIAPDPVNNIKAPNINATVAISDLGAGDSVWFLIDAIGVPGADATNVRLTLVQVPEPASIVMLLTTLGFATTLVLRRRWK